MKAAPSIPTKFKKPLKFSLNVQVAKVAGIPVRIHFSFLFFFLFIAFKDYQSASESFEFLFALFFCVFLHELGHALVAKKFGLHTKSITVYPIGGIAEIDSIVLPNQEFWVCLAGPAMNFLITVCLILGSYIFGITLNQPFYSITAANGPGQGTFLASLVAVNFILGAFNLLPAMPLDGGRIVRAAYILRFGPHKVDLFSAVIGTLSGLALAVLGLIQGTYLNTLFGLGLVFVSVIFSHSQKSIDAAIGKTAKDAMLSPIRSVSPETDLEDAAQTLYGTAQHDLPVVENGKVVGFLTQTCLMNGFQKLDAESRRAGKVSEFMVRTFPKITPETGLETLFDRAMKHGTLVVLQDGRAVGLLSAERISRYLVSMEAQKLELPK